MLDSGYESTNVTPVYEGNVVSRAMKRMEFGGKQITEYLRKLLAVRGRGYDFSTSGELEILTEMKEKLGYVAIDSTS